MPTRARAEAARNPGFDRDTEPIPRARFEAEPGRHAAADDVRTRGVPRDDPSWTTAIGVSDEADDPVRRARPTGPRPRRRPGRPRSGPTAVDGARSRSARRPRRRSRPSAAYRATDRSFDDDATLFQDFPDDLTAIRRYGGPSHVGGSFVVGEPITEEELGGLRGGSTPLVTSRRVVPLEDEPSPLVQRYLFPTEKFRGEWQRHRSSWPRRSASRRGVTIGVGLLAGYLARIDAADEITGLLVLDLARRDRAGRPGRSSTGGSTGSSSPTSG